MTDVHFLDMSEDLEDYFTRLEVLYHPGGHGIPLRAAQKKFFNNFFLECKDICFPGMHQRLEEADDTSICNEMEYWQF